MYTLLNLAGKRTSFYNKMYNKYSLFSWETWKLCNKYDHCLMTWTPFKFHTPTFCHWPEFTNNRNKLCNISNPFIKDTLIGVDRTFYGHPGTTIQHDTKSSYLIYVKKEWINVNAKNDSLLVKQDRFSYLLNSFSKSK